MRTFGCQQLLAAEALAGFSSRGQSASGLNCHSHPTSRSTSPPPQPRHSIHLYAAAVSRLITWREQRAQQPCGPQQSPSWRSSWASQSQNTQLWHPQTFRYALQPVSGRRAGRRTRENRSSSLPAASQPGQQRQRYLLGMPGSLQRQTGGAGVAAVARAGSVPGCFTAVPGSARLRQPSQQHHNNVRQ